MTAPPPLSADPKARLARLYTAVAQDYEAQGPPFFAHAGRRLVEVAGVAPAQDVLDVGTGRGAVLFPAAERVGPGGSVVGIDLAEGMVARTREEIERRGLTHVGVRQMDAERLEFPDGAFDRVLCSFAVFFFPDLERVLGEMRRVLRPGGVVGFAFTRGVDERWRWYEELLGTYGALEGLPPAPGKRGIKNEGALVGCLSEAGFETAAELVETTELALGDEETWWRSLWTHGSRVPLEPLPAETLERLRDECLARARAMKGPQGLVERVTFVYVTARKPGEV